MTSSNLTSLHTLLCLPAPDVQALGEGRSICAITALFVRPGKQFLLCPSETLDNADRLEWCYRSNVHFMAQRSLDALELDVPEIEYWASCEHCFVIDKEDQIDSFSLLSIWQKEWLGSRLKNKSNIFVIILRVHRLSSSFSLLAEIIYQDKLGKFFSIPESQAKSICHPILSDRLFAHRKQQLENLTPPEHPELEELKSAIDRYAKDHPKAQDFSDDLQEFLGWAEPKNAIDRSPDWVPEITTFGNSSNGDLFEKRVRQAFIQLGFTNTLNNIKASLDPSATGGAGGIDIYCEKPFAIVGECKASKNESVPNNVSAQLIHLGITHLGQNQFNASIKIIFASGKLTNHAEQAAIENKMNVMRPETLQRLAELKIAHPGSINLLELKPCLEAAPFGTDADDKVNKFIDKAQQQLKIRSYIVRSVKALKDDGDAFVTASTVRTHFNVSFSPTLKRLDDSEEAHAFLIELSSPLAGYLGRRHYPGRDWKVDRFYFLRDLTV